MLGFWWSVCLLLLAVVEADVRSSGSLRATLLFCGCAEIFKSGTELKSLKAGQRAEIFKNCKGIAESVKATGGSAEILKSSLWAALLFLVVSFADLLVSKRPCSVLNYSVCIWVINLQTLDMSATISMQLNLCHWWSGSWDLCLWHSRNLGGL